MMTDVACFCGCFYSFEGGAGPCPKCGEVAAVTAAPEAESARTCRPSAEADGDPIAGIAVMPDSELTRAVVT